MYVFACNIYNLDDKISKIITKDIISLCCIVVLSIIFYYIDPIAYLDSGYWSTLGFVGTHYCNYQSGSLFSCLTNNSYYLNHHYYYCNNNRDTVSLKCNIDTGELLGFYGSN